MRQKIIMQILILCLSVTACSTTSLNPFATKIDATIIVTADANPDHRGQASPIVIRIYELKSKTAFQRPDFFTLFDQEANALGDDLLAREQLELRPNIKRPFRKKVHKDTQYIGVVAAFQEIGQSQWFDIYEIKNHRKNKVTIKISEHTASINSQ